MLNATGYSARGLAATFRTEEGFRLELLAIAVLLPLSFWLASTVAEWLTLVIPLVLLLIVELLNSAIESVVDRIGPEHHPLSGQAKDMASAAVLLALVLVAVCWGAVAWRYINA